MVVQYPTVILVHYFHSFVNHVKIVRTADYIALKKIYPLLLMVCPILSLSLERGHERRTPFD